MGTLLDFVSLKSVFVIDDGVVCGFDGALKTRVGLEIEVEIKSGWMTKS